jgi:membrane protein
MMRLMVRRRPLSSLTLVERRVRWGLDMVRLAAIRLRRNRAGFMAAALSYRVLFSLIPLLALAAVVARWSVSEASFLEAVDDLIAQLGLNAVDIGPMQGSQEHSQLGEWLQAQAKAAMQINPASLGIIGVLVLSWSTYKLFDEVEAACSALTGGSRRRPLVQRLLTAMVLMVVLPVAATVGLKLLGSFIEFIPPATGATGGGLFHVAAMIVQPIIVVLVITLVVCVFFHFFPVSPPSWRASFLGAIFSAIALVLGEWGLRAYVFKAMPTSPVGGALGLVPLLMLWIYVMWICILYGLEMSVLIDRGKERWHSKVRTTQR